MVERGEITSNKIELTDGLIATFKRLWMQYVGDSDTFKSNIALPFWHMQSEPFWRLIVPNKAVEIIDRAPSISSLQKNGVYAEIALDLFELFRARNTVINIKRVLFAKYLHTYDGK